MPWVPLDTHWYCDPKIQRAGALTPFALSAFPAILAEAKQRADGGRVELTFRSLSHSLFISEDEARKAVAALVDVGVIEDDDVTPCHDLSRPVRFPHETWKRWNANFRKAQQREREAHE